MKPHHVLRGERGRVLRVHGLITIDLVSDSPLSVVPCLALTIRRIRPTLMGIIPLHRVEYRSVLESDVSLIRVLETIRLSHYMGRLLICGEI